MRIKVGYIFIIGMIFSSAAHAEADRTVYEENKSNSDDLVTIIKNADHGESYLVESSATTNGTKPKIGKWAILKQGPNLDKAQINELREVLLSEGGYDISSLKDCGFLPGPAFRLIHKNHHFDMLLCFTCNEVRFSRGSDELSKPASFSADARGKYLAFSKKIFPTLAIPICPKA